MFRTTLFKTVKPFNIQKTICGTLAVAPSEVKFYKENHPCFYTLTDLVVDEKVAREFELARAHGYEMESWSDQFNIWYKPTVAERAAQAAKHVALLAKYPHPVDPKDIEEALKLQAANRKFSAY